MALDIMGEETYKVDGVRTGAYDGEYIVVDSDAWAVACIATWRSFVVSKDASQKNLKRLRKGS